jgi:hypothetical protein
MPDLSVTTGTGTGLTLMPECAAGLMQLTNSQNANTELTLF